MNKRHKLSRRYSRKDFSYNAAKLNKKNLGGHARGGWTL